MSKKITKIRIQKQSCFYATYLLLLHHAKAHDHNFSYHSSYFFYSFIFSLHIIFWFFLDHISPNFCFWFTHVFTFQCYNAAVQKTRTSHILLNTISTHNAFFHMSLLQMLIFTYTYDYCHQQPQRVLSQIFFHLIIIVSLSLFII